MKIGWMWYDDGEHSLEEKVERAARAFEAKFSIAPNTYYAHAEPGEDRPSIRVNGIKVVFVSNILPHHFWLGRESPRSRAA